MLLKITRGNNLIKYFKNKHEQQHAYMHVYLLDLAIGLHKKIIGFSIKQMDYIVLCLSNLPRQLHSQSPKPD